MAIKEYLEIIATLIAIISPVGYAIYRILRYILLEEINMKTNNLVCIMVKDKEELQEKIDTGNKYIIKYIGNACEEKLKEYEQQNEKNREARQEGHDSNFKNILFSLDMIRKSIEGLQSDFKSYSNKTAVNESEISNLKDNLKELRNK